VVIPIRPLLPFTHHRAHLPPSPSPRRIHLARERPAPRCRSKDIRRVFPRTVPSASSTSSSRRVRRSLPLSRHQQRIVLGEDVLQKVVNVPFGPNPRLWLVAALFKSLALI
jgi:hypothetical protein